MSDKKKSKNKKITEVGNRADVRPHIALMGQAWITEKAGFLARYRKYIFIVSGRANKIEVKKTIEKNYGVKVNDVNVIKEKGKSKRLGRSVGRTSDFKKAIVTLKEGQKIETLTP